MLNSLFGADARVGQILNLIYGHDTFLKKNTGLTNNSLVDHYIINPQGIMANNRHFIHSSQQEGQPDDDATTEGQSLLILGYIYAYLGTGTQAYLDSAIYYFNSYVTYFYDGTEIPSTISRWICNWICNGKEPVLANWPVNKELPTHSGFKGVPMVFINGRTAIPQGTPYYGEYLDKSTFAFVGHLAWDAINASVKAVRADGTVNWDAPGIQYDVDWLVDYLGRKVDWDGNILELVSFLPKGTVQLKNTGVNGTVLLNFANRQPVEFGGVLIGRNQVQHNRPLHVPVTHDNMGNSADSEQWFLDACYLLYKITGDNKYYRAWKCTEFNVFDYASIDSKDKFFRQSTAATTPFTDGISYDYTYPNTVVPVYTRDTQGYINIALNAAADHTIEQQAVWFRLAPASQIMSTVGGVCDNGDRVSHRVEVQISADKNPDNIETWGMGLPFSTGLAPAQYLIPINSLAKLTKPDGTPYTVADTHAVTSYGDCTYTLDLESGVYDGRSAFVLNALLPDDNAGFIIGGWLTAENRIPLKNIVYRCTNTCNLRITDDNKWRWYWVLPNTANAWSNFQFNPANAVLSGYQPDHTSGETKPTAPVFSTINQATIILDGNTPNTKFAYYVLNDIPPLFTGTDGYIMMYRIICKGDSAYKVTVGDCTMTNFRNDSLYKTPGVIPFSNIYQSNAEEFDGWHGMPYPGYQHPMIWIDTMNEDNGTKFNNMVDFMYESQQWYYNKFGVLGPGASAYIWNRWDNFKYGTPDTWTMYHWGKDTAWSGYQPRAYFSAARAWYELVQRDLPSSDNLRGYVENWLTYLIGYFDKYGMSPTDFPPDKIPEPIPNDFTGHMCGLWLAGTCMALMAGTKVKGAEELAERLVRELADNYVVTGDPGNPMDGSWSPAVRLGTTNGMFFGFWAGEILRGLGTYLMYKRGIRI